MKKKKTANEIIKLYVEYATIEGKSKLEGDYKIGNKMVTKLNKIYEQLKSDPNLALDVLNAVLDSDSVRARGLAACDALRLNINIERAIVVLQQISKMKDIGILSYSAEMALQIWTEKGHLDP